MSRDASASRAAVSSDVSASRAAVSSDVSAPEEFLLVGAIVKAHALKGEVLVLAFNPASPLWKRGAQLALLPPDRASRGPSSPSSDDRVVAAPLSTLSLKQVRATPDGRLICDFAEVTDRDASERLVGHRLAVPLASLPSAGDDFYHHELRGLTVVDTAGKALGKVVGVFDGPAQDLLEVATDGVDDTWFVPFVDAIVKRVDRETGQIVIDPPEGLAP